MHTVIQFPLKLDLPVTYVLTSLVYSKTQADGRVLLCIFPSLILGVKPKKLLDSGDFWGPPLMTSLGLIQYIFGGLG